MTHSLTSVKLNSFSSPIKMYGNDEKEKETLPKMASNPKAKMSLKVTEYKSNTYKYILI